VVSVKAWIEPIIPDCLDVSVRTERERERERERRAERKRIKERERRKEGKREASHYVAHLEDEDVSCWWT